MENVLGGYGRLSPEGLVLLAKITPLKPTDAWPMMARVLEGDSEEARRQPFFRCLPACATPALWWPVLTCVIAIAGAQVPGVSGALAGG